MGEVGDFKAWTVGHLYDVRRDEEVSSDLETVEGLAAEFERRGVEVNWAVLQVCSMLVELLEGARERLSEPDFARWMVRFRTIIVNERYRQLVEGLADE